MKSVNVRGAITLTQPGATLNNLPLDYTLNNAVAVNGGGTITLDVNQVREFVLERSCDILRIQSDSGPFRLASDTNAENKSSTFTIDTILNELLTPTPLRFHSGKRVRLTTDGTLPTGLLPATDYYVISRGDGKFALATSEANAIAPAPVAIPLTDQGTGTHTVLEQDASYAYEINQSLQMTAFYTQTCNVARITLMNPGPNCIEIEIWAYARRS